MKIRVIHTLDPSLVKLLEATLLATADEILAQIRTIKDAIAADKAEILTAIGDEKNQVTMAIAALEQTIADVVTPDQFQQIKAELDSLRDAAGKTEVAQAVAALYEPS